MSVPKNKRYESPIEYIQNAQNLLEYTIKKCSKFPKSYTFYLSIPIADLAREGLRLVIKANDNNCKNKYELQICKICKKSITRMRRKLKIFRILVKYKKLTVDDVIESLTSWVAHAKNFYSHNSVKSILYLFSSLFGHRKNIYKLIHA